MKRAGVYKSVKKSGAVYYRSSFTFRQKHISLGSFRTEKKAHQAYLDAVELSRTEMTIMDYEKKRHILSFEKAVSIINFRDNNVYFANPIYLQNRFFEYYFTPDLCYKFDIDDLFYYAGHKISRRGGHLFVADYGMQVNLLSRYGIKSHAVKNRDYRFINQDDTDFRYENIEVINPYYGVKKTLRKGKDVYKASILINGRVVIGYYKTEEMAAIAYNKAADDVGRALGKHYRLNYIENLSPKEYAELYSQIKLPEKLKHPLQ